MSQLWPELLRITLCPDQIVLERGKPMISLKGIAHRYTSREIIPVEPRHEPSLWDAPLALLAIALDGLPERRHDVSVVLSNHFVRYPLVQADSQAPGVPTRGIVEPELEAALQRLLGARGCRLSALQPRILELATTQPDELNGEPGWLVLIEEGLACLGLIEDGEFVRLRNLYMWPASSVELLAVLDREAGLAGQARPPRTLLLWTRDQTDEVDLPANRGWHISRIGKPQSTPLPQAWPRIAAEAAGLHA